MLESECLLPLTKERPTSTRLCAKRGAAASCSPLSRGCAPPVLPLRIVTAALRSSQHEGAAGRAAWPSAAIIAARGTNVYNHFSKISV